MSVTIVWKEGIERALAESVNGAILQIAESAAAISYSRFGTQSGGRSSTPGSYPNTQSNNLRERITWRGDGGGVARFGTDVVYGPILEFGGTIRAKGKALPVPLNGEARRFLRNKQPGVSIKSLNLKYIPPKKGDQNSRGILGKQLGRKQKAGNKGDFVPWFALRKSVTIAARPWLRRVWPENTAELMMRARQRFTTEMKNRGFALGK